MPELEYTFYWGDEIVITHGRNREEAWERLMERSKPVDGWPGREWPGLKIEHLNWTGFRGGFMCCLDRFSEN